MIGARSHCGRADNGRRRRVGRIDRRRRRRLVERLRRRRYLRRPNVHLIQRVRRRPPSCLLLPS